MEETKTTNWYGFKPKDVVGNMNNGDLLFYGNKAFRKEKGILEDVKNA